MVFALTLAPCSWLIIGTRQRLGAGKTQHRLAIFPGGNMSHRITFITMSMLNANAGTGKQHSRMWSVRLNDYLQMYNSVRSKLINKLIIKLFSEAYIYFVTIVIMRKGINTACSQHRYVPLSSTIPNPCLKRQTFNGLKGQRHRNYHIRGLYVQISPHKDT